MIKTYREQRLSAAECESAAENCVQYAEMVEDDGGRFVQVTLTADQVAALRGMVHHEITQTGGERDKRAFLEDIAERLQTAVGNIKED